MMPVGVLLGLCGLGAGACIAARQIIRRTSDPANWPADISQLAAVRRAKRFLRAQGWQMLPPWDWAKVWIRAERNDTNLNLVVYDPRINTLHTTMKDAILATRYMNAEVGIITTETPGLDLADEAGRNGIYFVSPAGLKNAEVVCRQANDRKKRAGAAAESAAARPAEPDKIVTTAPAPKPQASAIKGFVEFISAATVRGWAFAEQSPSPYLNVTAMVAGNVVGYAPANQYREDLAKAGIGNGEHAFSIAFGRALSSGEQERLHIVVSDGYSPAPRLPRLANAMQPTPENQAELTGTAQTSDAAHHVARKQHA